MKRDYPVTVAYYFFYYMGGSVLANFLPLFLSENVGVSSTQLGFLLAIGPATAIVFQPFWGLRTDRARFKNSVLILLLVATLLSSLLIPLHPSFWYVTVAVLLLSCFQTSNIPVSDAITVELCNERSWDYGRIRTAGSVGYSCMGLIAGLLIGGVQLRQFPLFAGLTAATVGLALLLPRVPGHQREKIRMPYLVLLKDKRLVVVLCISFFANLTLGMHYSFYGVYFRELGGSTALLGLAVFFASMFELPFSLNSRRFIKLLGGPENTLLVSTAVMTVRWFLASRVTSATALLLVNCLHGFSFVVLAITITVFIGEYVPPELKATGQTLHGMVSTGLARILGSIGAGFLVGIWGKPVMFAVAGVINVLALAVFVPLVRRRRT